MNRNAGGLNWERVHRGIIWLRARFIPLAWLWCCGILLGVVVALAGCQTTQPDPITFASVEASACAAAYAKPATAPYL